MGCEGVAFTADVEGHLVDDDGDERLALLIEQRHAPGFAGHADRHVAPGRVNGFEPADQSLIIEHGICKR